VDVAPVASLPDRMVLDALRGPRDDWFTAAALGLLAASTWTVSQDSNRIAIRLAGPVLERAVPGELPSEGLLRGAIQVPPNGQPVLFLADHPVTGGYPVIAVVDDAGVDLAAQARPGDVVRITLR
jgi:allophanate hydrolase subunit 2